MPVTPLRHVLQYLDHQLSFVLAGFVAEARDHVDPVRPLGVRLTGRDQLPPLDITANPAG